MIIDRYTKFIFTLIAISLFVISLNPWIAPTKAYAAWGVGSERTLNKGLMMISGAINRIDCKS
jgi:hypothetical protein